MTFLDESGLSLSLWQRFLGRVEQEHEAWRRGSLLCMLPIMPLVLGGLLGVYRWHTDSVVSQREKMTMAAITSQAANRRFGYQFSVDAKSYTGWSPPKQGMSIGQKIPVFYDQAHPEVNSPEDFARSSVAWLGFGTIGLVAGVTLIVIVFRNRRGSTLEST